MFSFQISKMKFFKIFISRQNFSNFNSYLRIEFFVQFSHFPLLVWPKFSKFKTKIFNSNFKNKKKSIFFISNFPCDINNFFLSLKLPNLLKDCKNYLFTLTKNSYILHTTLVHRKRGLKKMQMIYSCVCFGKHSSTSNRRRVAHLCPLLRRKRRYEPILRNS
jgi:hypothetical protein